jgi:hypothetical protein
MDRNDDQLLPTAGTFQSFHVKDPDGWDLQICNGEGLVKARKRPQFRKTCAAGRRGGGAAPADGAALAVAPERRAVVDHISFGISPWDVDGVRSELEKRGLSVSVDTSSAH